MLAFGVVTLFLIMLLFSLQSFVLNYFMIVYFNQYCYFFVGIDGLLLLYMLSSYHIDLAATRGGVQWLLYSWSLIAKLSIYYWFIFGSQKNFESSLIGSFGIYAVLFLTPVLYTILSFRSARQLYGNTRAGVISIESMLHADMVVHVMVDLLDLMTAFRFAELPASVVKHSPWVHTATGVCIVVAIFMHSYSFPTTAILNNLKKVTGNEIISGDRYQPAHQGDIFLTRKHAALVAMFLVDIPLLVIRLYLWITFPKDPGMSPFLVKNIIFLPLQAFRYYGLLLLDACRLNQCRLAERERAKSTQKVFSINAEADDSAETKVAPSAQHDVKLLLPHSPHSTTESDSQPFRRSILGHNVHKKERSSAKYGPRGKQERSRSLDSESLKNNISVFGDLTDDVHETSEAIPERNAKMKDDNFLNDTLKSYEIKQRRVEQIIEELKSIRELPVRGFGFFRLVVRIYHCIRSGTRIGLAGLLDENFVLSYWKQVRIAMPLLVAWGSQILIVVMTRNYIRDGGPSDMTDWNSWTLVPEDYKLFIYVAGANLVLMFLFWVGNAPLLDVIFVTLFWIVRLTSFFLVFTTVRDTRFLKVQSRWHALASADTKLIWGFIVVPCLRLLDALFCIQGAFLGRKYMYFVVPSPNRTMQAGLLNSVSKFRETHNTEEKSKSAENVHNECVGANRTDESGWVTTSSVLVFLNCRHSLAPISFGELLIGPDLIKDVRLIDMMVLRSWLETLFQFLIYCITLIIFFDFIILGIFLGNLIMKMTYNIFIQAIRLLSLRRYEIKILFEEIVRAWGDTGSGSYLEIAALDNMDEAKDKAQMMNQQIPAKWIFYVARSSVPQFPLNCCPKSLQALALSFNIMSGGGASLTASRFVPDVSPNQSLFCCNLNTKIHLTDLKSCLLEFFCPFGQILDIVASKKDPKKRGNAFIVFADITAATTALRSLHGKDFLGRPVGINYAKTKSDRVAQLDGSFKIRRKRLLTVQPVVLEDNAVPQAAQPQPIPKGPAGATLFVENLPSIMNEGALAVLFNQYPGFHESRLVPGRCIGFVDFSNEMQAELAMHGLNGFLVTPEAPLKISLARK